MMEQAGTSRYITQPVKRSRLEHEQGTSATWLLLTFCGTYLRIPYMTYESKRVLRFSQSGMQRDRRR
jgi:hypothetical protein